MPHHPSVSSCRAAFLLVIAAGIASAPVLGAGDVLPVKFRLEQVLTGTARPSGIAIAPDGRIFFGERTTGNVRIVKGGQLVAAPFVNIPVASAGAGEGLIDVVLHPQFARNGWVYVFYTETGTRANKIRRYTDVNGTAQSPLDILSLPASADGSRVGGSMAFGTDGKLYVSTGDLATPANAQNNASLAGKVLRINEDGSVPANNPIAGNRVYAKGFRNGGGLALNASVGTLYQTDQGSAAPAVKEECNAVTEGNGATLKNYAWDAGSGKLNNPSYVDPLTEHATIVTPAAVVPYTASRYPASYLSDVYYACASNGRIEEVNVSGAKLDVFGSSQAFYDPANDGDGTADTLCPKKWVDNAVSGDGYIYYTADPNTSANGIYRVLYDDTTGPREVSPAGSTHSLWISRLSPSQIRLTWEDQKKDAFVGAPLAVGQHNSKYSIWEGSLPIDSNADGSPDWSHLAAATPTGTTVNDGTLSHDLNVGGGSKYYLVSSQNTNKEGPLGFGSGGGQIPGVGPQDWCGVLGFGTGNNQCPPEFLGENGLPLLLPDENGVLHSLHEFRTGNILHIDLAAFDCGPCQLQALNEDVIEDRYRARGFNTVMILEKNLSGAHPYTNQTDCTNAINSWRASYGGTYTILCDKDTNGDGDGDAFIQFNRCGAFPSNYYIDRNWSVYQFDCGFSPGLSESRIAPKVYPEWCE